MKTQIIADIGLNHDGDPDKAKELIDFIASLEQDITAKFQMFWCFDDLRQYTFSEVTWEDIIKHCTIAGVKMFVTAFDKRAVDFMVHHGQRTWKVPSGMLTNRKYIEYLNHVLDEKTALRILSTGMGTWSEIDDAVKLFAPDIIMHCVSAYPAPLHELNLNALHTIRERYHCTVGYSDHSGELEVPPIAVAMGAHHIEVHLTHNRHAQGPDHRASLDKIWFKAMVKAVRGAENMLGTGNKEPMPSELGYRDAVRARMQTI